MNSNFFENEYFIYTCIILSLLRIYLEVIKFDFEKLPLTKLVFKNKQKTFHKWGLYLSIGQILFFIPRMII